MCKNLAELLKWAKLERENALTLRDSCIDTKDKARTAYQRKLITKKARDTHISSCESDITYWGARQWAFKELIERLEKINGFGKEEGECSN